VGAPARHCQQDARHSHTAGWRFDHDDALNDRLAQACNETTEDWQTIKENIMSNTEPSPELYESLECPVVEGHRLIQHLAARTADVSGIPVNRLMPQRGRRLIGAWCFLDHAGPAVF
jgi:hypothetical protein